MHPEGNFDCSIEDHGYADGNKGPQLWVTYKTEHSTITGYFSMSEAAAEYTVEKIRNMGYQGDTLSELADGEALRGMWCNISVAHETYDGKTRAKVGFVNPYGQPGGAPVRSEAASMSVSRFDALLRSKAPKKIEMPEPPAEYDERNPPPVYEPSPF